MSTAVRYGSMMVNSVLDYTTIGVILGLVGRLEKEGLQNVPFLVGGSLVVAGEIGTRVTKKNEGISLKRRLTAYGSYALGVAVANADRFYYAMNNLFEGLT